MAHLLPPSVHDYPPAPVIHAGPPRIGRGAQPDVRLTRRPRRPRKSQPQPLEAHFGSQHAGMNCRPDRVERRWTPLAAQMGYTSDDSQRAEILTAIDQMTWTALDSDAPWPSFLAGRATRAIVSAVIPRQRRKCGLGSARMAPRTSGRMLLGVQDRPGERLYLLDLDRGIAIHVLTEISSDEPPINRTGPRG